MVVAPVEYSFQPAVPGASSRLSEAQIEHYNREGFVQPFDIFSDTEIAAVRAYLDRLMVDKGDDACYGINCYQARLAGLWDIATDTRILDHVEAIIGEDIVCWASAVLSKPPNDTRVVPWHQDAGFWKLSPTRTVTVWLAIDDADAANAAMRFLPRSHDRGPLETIETDEHAVFHKGVALPPHLGSPFTNTLKAGQISLHADMLVHGSEANRSARRRCGLTLRYCPPDVRVIDRNWAAGVEAIICRGEDVSRHWVHHPRPSGDDILRVSSPHVIGNN